MKLDRLTLSVTCGLVFLLLAYDIWTLAFRGYSTTVSHTLYVWSKDWPAIPFAFGFFAGHLFFPNKAGMPALGPGVLVGLQRCHQCGHEHDCQPPAA